MITGKTVERMLILTRIAPFDILKESELVLVAQHLHQRSFKAGEMVFAAGQIADAMIVVVSGSAHSSSPIGQRAQPAALGPAILGSAVLGDKSILFSDPIEEDIFAGPDGIEALCLAKPHLFTIARECPDFVVGLTRLAHGVQS